MITLHSHISHTHSHTHTHTHTPHTHTHLHILTHTHTFTHTITQFVYVSVRGHASRNHFSVIIWDMIFEEDLYTVPVSEGVSDLDVFDLNDALRMTNVT